MLTRRVVVAGLMSLGVAAAARAETQPNIAATRRLVSELIIPDYDTLVMAAQKQTVLWQAFLANPNPQAVVQLKSAYLAAADAWSAIEFLHFGPASADFRFERISYWPERKNATGKALALLLAGKGDEGLGEAQFAKTSAAGQGLPALERLLFDENAEALLLAKDGAGDRRRRVGRAIARNIKIIATQILTGWRDGPDSIVKKLDDPAYAGEATIRIATDLLSLFQLMRDAKLQTVLGKTIDLAKPRLAEGWRSGRSIRALAVNLAALRDAVDIIFAGSSDEVSSPSVLVSSVRIADSLTPENLSALVTSAKQRSDAVLLLDAVTSARDVMNAEIPNALGITVGFNSLDGD